MDLIEDMIIKGAKPNTIKRYLFSLKAFSKFIIGPMAEQSQEQIHSALVMLMQSSRYSSRTKEDIKMAVRRYYRYIGRDITIPFNRQQGSTFTKADLLVPEDIDAMLSVASKRDAAAIQLLWDSGIRPQELLEMNISSINFNAAEVTVEGKTGPRTIPITSTTLSLLEAYLIAVPRLVPDAKLWVANPKSNHYGRLSGFGLTKALRSTAGAAGISKNITLYLFRHSAATRDAAVMPEAILRQKFGWSRSSRMAEVYVHLAARDLHNYVQEQQQKYVLLEHISALEKRLSSIEQKTM